MVCDYTYKPSFVFERAVLVRLTGPQFETGESVASFETGASKKHAADEVSSSSVSKACFTKSM